MQIKIKQQLLYENNNKVYILHTLSSNYVESVSTTWISSSCWQPSKAWISAVSSGLHALAARVVSSPEGASSVHTSNLGVASQPSFPDSSLDPAEELGLRDLLFFLLCFFLLFFFLLFLECLWWCDAFSVVSEFSGLFLLWRPFFTDPFLDTCSELSDFVFFFLESSSWSLLRDRLLLLLDCSLWDLGSFISDCCDSPLSLVLLWLLLSLFRLCLPLLRLRLSLLQLHLSPLRLRLSLLRLRLPL